MNEITVKAISEVEPYAGEHAIPGVRFRAVRDALAVTAWGMNVIEIDPHNEGYPEHDHAEDGQEEVYVILEGAAKLVSGEDEVTVRAGQLVRVPPAVRRRFITGEAPVVFLAIGGTPGKAYPSGS
ncbi:MAG: cupin domain-containing protein [Myxococcota bacterium]